MVRGVNLGPCCLALLAAFGSKVSVPGSKGYNESLSSYYVQQEQALQPLCIVKPDTTGDVSTAIRIIYLARDSPLKERNSQCNFAVRSGGHGIIEGSANIAGGITIDLRALNRIEIVGSITSVGAGATWDGVYAKLDPLNLSVAGGRNAGVGVGGLTTGGGISFFSPRYGWTCDTVTNYEVVLANGTIVNANADGNPDLLWALRGGSNNFGIVTRIDLHAFKQDGLWGGMSYYNLSTIDDHLTAFVDFNSADTYDEYASLITSFVLFSGSPPVLATNMEYTKPVENPPSLHALTSIPAISSTLRITNMTELSIELASIQPYGLRQLWAEVTLASTVSVLNATFHRWSESLSIVQNVPGIAWAISLEPLPPVIYNRGANLNAFGLGDRSGSFVIALLTATWTDTADDTRVTTAVQTLMKNIKADAKILNAYDPFLYLNYAAPLEDPIASYGAENVERLRKVREQVDPHGIFTYNVPGGFKISAK